MLSGHVLQSVGRIGKFGLAEVTFESDSRGVDSVDMVFYLVMEVGFKGAPGIRARRLRFALVVDSLDVLLHVPPGLEAFFAV